MTRTRKAGFGTEPPSESCDDSNCPFHGSLKIRGKHFTGKVVSDKMQRSVVVEWVGWRYIPKYERYKRAKTKVLVHNPPCINAAEGDMVKIVECRPLSKTKSFVVIQKLGKVEKYRLEKDALEEGKHKEKEKVKAKTEKKTAKKETKEEGEQ